MDVLTYLAIGLLAFVIMIWYRRATQTSFRSPPGPRPLPLVGSIFSINFPKMHLTFAKLAEEYGKIVVMGGTMDPKFLSLKRT